MRCPFVNCQLLQRILLVVSISGILLGKLPVYFPVDASHDQHCTADISRNGYVGLEDYSIMVLDFFTPEVRSDLDQSGEVDLLDYHILVNHFFTTCSPTQPSSTPTPTPAPTVPPQPVSSYLWLSPAEIRALPDNTTVKSIAESDWGSANLGDNNSNHDVKTLAGALYAVHQNDDAMRSKVVAALKNAMTTSDPNQDGNVSDGNLTRALELSRGLQTYIIAADIIDYRETSFQTWVKQMILADVQAHNSGDPCNSLSKKVSCTGVRCTAIASTNNWGGHARASFTAAALYLRNSTSDSATKVLAEQWLQESLNAHKTFIGELVPNNFVCNDTTWHDNQSQRFGVNKKGTTRNGISISGVLPEDWRRNNYDFTWLPGVTGYMWEGIQGFVVNAVLFHRADLIDFSAGDEAVVRSLNILYGKGEAAQNTPVFYNPATGDDSWIPWLVNKYAGTAFPTTTAIPGKNMGYTDWTHK